MILILFHTIILIDNKYTDSSLMNDNSITDKDTSVTVEPGNTMHVYMMIQPFNRICSCQ